MNFTISTFSFGYHIDSELMEDIARIGGGVYGYCPDATMVGTIFINYLANIMNALTQKAIISVKSQKYQGTHELNLYSNKSQNILIELPKGTVDGTEITLNIPITNQQLKIQNIQKVETEFQLSALHDQIYRYKLMNLIKSNLLNSSKGQTQTKLLFTEIENIPNQSDFLKKLLIDLVNPHPNHGQIEKAFDQQFYKKWGKDYLRSLLRFHDLELCGNFKDESLQFYVTPQFEIIRKAANKIFLNIPPPVLGKGIQDRYLQNYAPTQYYNLNVIYDYGGGCFDGNSIVQLQNGEKKVKEIKKGDILIDGGVVDCLVETIQNKEQYVVEINKTLFSPYHPIKHNGVWVFPINVRSEKKVHVSSWFNIVCHGNKVVRVNGTEAITLGHGMTEGVLSHPYFGTNAVLQSLKKRDGFTDGKIVIPEPLIIKRDLNGLISDYF
jgi:hypothetical protein